MGRYFTRTFFRFVLAFVAILALAFGVFIIEAQFQPPPETGVAQ